MLNHVSFTMKDNIAMITWTDARTTSGWQPGFVPTKEFTVITAGFVVHEDPENITVAQSIDPNGAYNNTITIPKSVVMAVEYYPIGTAID